MNIKMISHKKFIPKDRLPTFSIHTIHANLHRLAHCLTDPFVLMEDDTFITASLNLHESSNLHTNYLATERARWPMHPPARATFARGVQMAKHTLMRAYGHEYIQNVPSHAPQIVHHKTLYATSALFWNETLAIPHRPFRSLLETNTRMLWNGVDRKLGIITSQPSSASVARFVEVGITPLARLSSELKRIKTQLINGSSGVKFLTMNDCIDTDNDTVVSTYAHVMHNFMEWLMQYYSSYGNSTSRLHKTIHFDNGV